MTEKESFCIFPVDKSPFSGIIVANKCLHNESGEVKSMVASNHPLISLHRGLRTAPIYRPGVQFMTTEGARRANRWAVVARVIVIALAVLSVSVLVIWAVRAALTRDEAVLEAQARERVGMHFAAADWRSPLGLVSW